MSTARRISVEERDRQANEERIAEIQANLARNGLSDYLSSFTKSLWRYYDKRVVCDAQGKAIATQGQWAKHVAESFGEILEQKIEPFTLNNGAARLTVYLSDCSLTIPERHTLVAMTRYFEVYYPGFKAGNAEVCFPEAMAAYAAPANYGDEADAYEAAEVLAEIATAQTDVVKTDEGYAVVLRNSLQGLTDYGAILTVGACYVLEQFHCTRKPKESFDVMDDQEGFAPWQKCVSERYTQQQRIESKLDTLLARMEAGGNVVNIAMPAEPPAGDPHVRPVKTKKSGKSKQKVTTGA